MCYCYYENIFLALCYCVRASVVFQQRTLHRSMYIWCPSSTLVRIMLAYFLAIYIAVDCFSPAVYSFQTYPKLAYEYASNFFGVPTELYMLYKCALHIRTYLVGWMVVWLDRAHFLSTHRLTFCLSITLSLSSILFPSGIFTYNLKSIIC